MQKIIHYNERREGRGWLMLWSKYLKQENGQALVLVALSMVMLFGFAGLVVDGGQLYMSKSELQKAADSGALAGANTMLEGKETAPEDDFNYVLAKSEALVVALENYDNSDISFEIKTYPDIPEKGVIQVEAVEEVSFFLMSALGFTQSDVYAIAQAKVSAPKNVGIGDVLPIGIQLNEDLVFGEPWDLTSSYGDGSKGNYGLLDFRSVEPDGDGYGGAQGVGKYIDEGSPGPIVVGDKIDTQTGHPITSPHITDAIEARVGEMIYVPIIDDFGSGKEEVEVLGFAAFILTGIVEVHNPPDPKTLTIQGTFVNNYMSGELEFTEEGGYGTFTSRLIK